MMCLDLQDPLLRTWPDVSLRSRGVNYKIIDFNGKLYVADYNKMTCLHEGGHDIDLYFLEDNPLTTTVDETTRKCRRLTTNGGFEEFDAEYTTQI